jgi:hypothetical protein
MAQFRKCLHVLDLLALSKSIAKLRMFPGGLNHDLSLNNLDQQTLRLPIQAHTNSDFKLMILK